MKIKQLITQKEADEMSDVLKNLAVMEYKKRTSGMTREQLVSRVELVLREHGSVLYHKINNDTIMFEGEVRIGEIVDVLISMIYHAMPEVRDVFSDM